MLKVSGDFSKAGGFEARVTSSPAGAGPSTVQSHGYERDPTRTRPARETSSTVQPESAASVPPKPGSTTSQMSPGVKASTT